MYAIAYHAILMVVGLLFQWVFPQNHAYASLAEWMAGFIFAAYFMPTLKNIAVSYALYLCLALADSFLDWGWLGSHDTAGSLMFPVIGSVVIVSPLMVTWAMRTAILKYKSSREGT